MLSTPSHIIQGFKVKRGEIYLLGLRFYFLCFDEYFDFALILQLYLKYFIRF